jgi:hypothetical protein
MNGLVSPFYSEICSISSIARMRQQETCHRSLDLVSSDLAGNKTRQRIHWHGRCWAGFNPLARTRMSPMAKVRIFFWLAHLSESICLSPDGGPSSDKMIDITPWFTRSKNAVDLELSLISTWCSVSWIKRLLKLLVVSTLSLVVASIGLTYLGSSSAVVGPCQFKFPWRKENWFADSHFAVNIPRSWNAGGNLRNDTHIVQR